jgi:hypothetical protein
MKFAYKTPDYPTRPDMPITVLAQRVIKVIGAAAVVGILFETVLLTPYPNIEGEHVFSGVSALVSVDFHFSYRLHKVTKMERGSSE